MPRMTRGTVSRTGRPLAVASIPVVFALLLVALLVVGAARRDVARLSLASEQVATSTAEAVESPATPSAVAVSRGEAATAFTRCMRDNGVSDFPGITIEASGRVQLNGRSSLSPLSAVYRAAVRACAAKLPAGSTLPNDPNPPNPAEPTLSFTCTQGCPAAPKAPQPPE